MNLANTQRSVHTAFNALINAQKASTKASDARFALPAGSSRAKVTTANARWMRASEDRDRQAERLRKELLAALALLGPLGGGA